MGPFRLVETPTRDHELSVARPVEELLLGGGPGSVGVAEGDKRHANGPLAACGRPDGVRATQRRGSEQMGLTKASVARCGGHFARGWAFS